MSKPAQRVAEQAHHDAIEQAQHAGRGGGNLFATLISAFALVFSGYSFYESVLRAPELAIYVPPQINYTDPDRPDSPLEVFIIPVTLANDGARTATVLSINLEVTNPRSGAKKKFFATRTGAWGQTPSPAFAPISLAGKASLSQSIQFVPQVGEAVPRILDLEPAAYDFKLTLSVAAASSNLWFAPRLQPLTFTMQAGQMDYRNFNQTGTMALWSKDYASPTSRPN